jgi:Uncharacterized alpha/beta hydrolase domain (DUF2235)
MGKKIVLCIDGTGDFAADNPTNVFRLFCELDKSDPAKQVVYYDGGVGTLADNNLNTFKRRVYQGLDLAFGISLKDNFIKAYTFLVDNYEKDAEVYVFGFSRGAYGARVLCGVVQMFGIVRPQQKNLIAYIWQYYSKFGKQLYEKAGEYRKQFSRDDVGEKPITYLGLWDTVSTIGLINQKTFPYTSKLGAVKRCRHGVATDELRNMFPENILYFEPETHEEVWFAGVHRDVGGGGYPGSRPLCKIPYDWVTAPLRQVGGLLFDLSPGKDSPPDPCCPIWNQGYFLTAGYGVIGIIPQLMWTWNTSSEGGKKKLYILSRWLRIREPRNSAKIHCSILRRAADTKLKYLPTKILESKTAFANSTFQAYCDCADKETCPSKDFPNRILA